MRYSRPSARPIPVDATLGQTVITVASATDGGVTPEIAWKSGMGLRIIPHAITAEFGDTQETKVSKPDLGS
jgi:hypothetical protein